MRTLKISLALIVLVAIAIFAIRSFVTTDKVGEIMQSDNPFIAKIQQEIKSIQQKPDNQFCKDYYNEIVYHIDDHHKYSRLGKSRLENDIWKDNLTKQLYAAYSDKFIKQAYYIFSRSEWKIQDLGFIRSECAALQNSPTLERNSPFDKKFNEIKSIFSKYDEISEFISSCKRFSYSETGLEMQFPVEEVRNKISISKNYRNHRLENSYVNNCSYLHNGLNEIPQILFVSHCAYLDKIIAYWLKSYTGYGSQKSYRDNVWIPLKDKIEKLDNDIYNASAFEIEYNRLKHKWDRKQPKLIISLILNKIMLMKIILHITLIMCVLSPTFAQNDLIDRLTKQAVEIDSLKKAVKVEMNSKRQLIKEKDNFQDTLKNLKLELSRLGEFRVEKRKNDTILRQKTDSIILLKVDISEREKQIVVEKQIGEQKARDEYEKGKNEILTTIVFSYKNKSFDELLKSSTRQSVLRDLQLLKNTTEIKQILSDIEKYFYAKELLGAKFDASQIKNVQIQLAQIKHESALLDKLNEMLGKYLTITNGLKEAITKVVVLDNTEAVSGMSNEIQRKKFDKILAEISGFIFNYDFNFSDYPYLADILMGLIKRKLPNADADISDLLKKL